MSFGLGVGQRRGPFPHLARLVGGREGHLDTVGRQQVGQQQSGILARDPGKLTAPLGPGNRFRDGELARRRGGKNQPPDPKGVRRPGACARRPYGTVIVWVLLLVAPPLSVTVRVRAKVRADGKVREKLAAVETVLPAASFHA